MQDAARHALSQYCSLFSGVADGFDLKYYPRRSTDNAGATDKLKSLKNQEGARGRFLSRLEAVLMS